MLSNERTSLRISFKTNLGRRVIGQEPYPVYDRSRMTSLDSKEKLKEPALGYTFLQHRNRLSLKSNLLRMCKRLTRLYDTRCMTSIDPLEKLKQPALDRAFDRPLTSH
jgi:hypothetical protein